MSDQLFPTPGLAQAQAPQPGISQSYTSPSFFPLGNPQPFLTSPLTGAPLPQINPPTTAGAQLLSTPPPPPHPHGLGGFFVNLGRDAIGMVQGVGSLIGMGYHDVAKGLSEAVTLGQGNWGGGYDLAAVAKVLPHAFASDYASRYGGWSKFVHGLYEHPLSFLSDALAVATLGGTAAADGAAIAAKAADAASVVTDAVRLAEAGSYAESAAKLASIPPAVARVLPAYRVPEGLAEGTPDAIRALKIQSEAINQGAHAGFSRIVMRGNDPIKIPASLNPIRRLTDPLRATVLTRPIDAIRNPLGFEGPGPGSRSIEEAGVQGANTRAYAEYRQSIAKANDITHEYRPFIENRVIGNFTKHLFGNQSTTWLYNRNKVMKEFQSYWEGISAEERPGWALAIQGLDSVPLSMRPKFSQIGAPNGMRDIPQIMPPTAEEEAMKIAVDFRETTHQKFVNASKRTTGEAPMTAKEMRDAGARAFLSPDGRSGYVRSADHEVLHTFGPQETTAPAAALHAGVPTAGDAVLASGHDYAFPFQYSQDGWVAKRMGQGVKEPAAIAEHKAAVLAAMEEGNHVPYWAKAAYAGDESMDIEADRAALHLEFMHGLEKTNVPLEEQNLPFYFYDRLAEAAVANNPEQYPTTSHVFRLLRAEFTDHWNDALVGLQQRRKVYMKQDLKALLKAGKIGKGKDWYTTSHEALAAMAKYTGSGHSVMRVTKEKVRDFDLLLQLVAVTSPQRKPLFNLRDALRILDAFKKGEPILDSRFPERGGLRVNAKMVTDMVNDVLDGFGPRSPEWRAKAFAEDVGKQTRQKITDYHDALAVMNELDRKAALPVIDTWMGRIFGYGPYGDYGKVAPGKEYREIQDFVLKLADEHGIAPIEAQAQLWVGYKAMWGGAMRRDINVLQEARDLAQGGKKTAAIRLINKLEGRQMSMYEDIKNSKRVVETFGLFGPDQKIRPEYVTADNISKFIKRAQNHAGKAEEGGGYEVGMADPNVKNLLTSIRHENRSLKQIGGEYRLLKVNGMLPEKYLSKGGTLTQLIDDTVNGATHWGEDGHAVMTFFHTADTTTFVHEGAHFLRRLLDNQSMQDLERFYGVADKADWTVEQEERFARDVEKYFGSGQGPKDMMGVFSRLKTAIAAVWAKFHETIGGGVSDEVRAVLDRWFQPAPTRDAADASGLAARVYHIWPTQAQAQLEIARRFAKTATPEELARVNRLSGLDQALLLETIKPPSRGLADSLDPLVRQGTSDGNLQRSINVPYEASIAGEPHTLDLTAYGEGVQADVPDPPSVENLRPDQFFDTADQIAPPSTFDRMSWRHAEGDQFVQPNSRAQVIVNATVPDWNDVPALIDSLTPLGDRVGLYNGARTPHELGYRGINLDVRTQDGNIIQVRIQTPMGHLATTAIGEHGGMATRFSYWGARQQQLEEELGKKGPDGGLLSGRTEEDVQADLELAKYQLARGQAAIQNYFTPVALEQKESLSGLTPDGRRVFQLSAGELAMERTRLGVLLRLTTPMIKAGQLDLAQLFDRDYLPMRIASGAHYDNKVSGFVGGLDPLDLNRARQAAHLPPPFYFPLIDASRTKYSDFLVSRQAVGALNSARAKYSMRATGKLIERGDYITDPVLVYQRRAAMALRHTETYRFVQSVIEHFGRPIQSAQEVSPGEVLFAPDGMMRMFHARIYTEDALMRAVAAGTDDQAAMQEVLEQILPVIQGHIAFQGRAMTKQGIPLYAIPKVVGDQLAAFSKYRLGPGARIFWDGPTNLWRGMVLMGSPRWMVNNLVGNMLFLKLQGGGLTDLVHAMMPSYRRMLDQLPDDAIARINTGLYGSASNYTERIGSAADKFPGTTKVVDRMQSSRPYKLTAALGHGSRAANEAIENAFRRASYLRAAERIQVKRNVMGVLSKWTKSARYASKIQEVGADEVMREAAIREMNYFLNDYTALGPIERNIVRRFVAPFWGFYRHIFRLMFTLPAVRPVRFDAFRALATVGHEITQGYGPLPSWMQGDVAIGAGGQPGDVTFLSTSGPNPFNVLTSNPMGWLHPFWKIAYEESTGRSALTGKEFSAPDVITPYGSDQSFKVGPDGTIAPVDRVAPGLGEEILRQFPQYQLAEQVAAGGAMYDTTTLPGALSARAQGYPAGGGVIPGTTPGTARYPVDAIQNFMRLLGYSTFDYNPAKYQTQLASNEAAALADWIKSQGLAPTSNPLTVAHAVTPPTGLFPT